MTDWLKPQSLVTRREMLAVLGACVMASIAAVGWSWANGAMLNYGDAVAHLHIARRVLDSRFPGFTQLGSVWLPLPHILLFPFVQIYSWWANGLAAVLPSSFAYLAACVGFYRLARRWMQAAAAALALAFLAANPNLLYLQTTAMTEPLFLCEMIWIAVWMVEFRSGLETEERLNLMALGLLAATLIAAVFTRYDGWIMALLAWTGAGILLARRGLLRNRAFWIASSLVIAAPIAWFAYNAFGFGDWLFFMRGPYSAAAIEARTSVPGFPPHPGWHNPWVALLFFLKAAEKDAAAGRYGNLTLVLALIGTVWAWVTQRRRAVTWAIMLLWLPVPFYAYSVAYGSVPIFLPVWWPYSYYNLRYGLELLPAIALGLGFVAQFAFSAVRAFKPAPWNRRWTAGVALLLFLIVALNAVQMIREKPLVYEEGVKNAEARRPYELEIPPVLQSLLAQHPGSSVLTLSLDPEIIALTGIPLRQTINEGDREYFRDALADPAGHAPIILAFDGDAIDQAVHAHPAGLTVVRRFQTPYEPGATIYVSGTPAATHPGNPAGAVIASAKEIE